MGWVEIILCIIGYICLCYALAALRGVILRPIDDKEPPKFPDPVDPLGELSDEEFTRNFMKQLEFKGENYDQNKN